MNEQSQGAGALSLSTACARRHLFAYSRNESEHIVSARVEWLRKVGEYALMIDLAQSRAAQNASRGIYQPIKTCAYYDQKVRSKLIRGKDLPLHIACQLLARAGPRDCIRTALVDEFLTG
jgi:hypothetical protein